MFQIIPQSLIPWARREAPAARVAAFDGRAEQSRLTTQLLRRAAALLASPLRERSGAEQQVQAFCDALTEASPHLRLAWVWFGDAGTPRIVPGIVAGPASDYARSLDIPRNALTERGPAFRALAGQAAEPFNVSAWSLYPPWRDMARRHDVRAVIALPLAAPGDTRRGLFVLYADVPDYFDHVGVGVFEALAELVGTVLANSARQEQLLFEARTDMLTGLPNRAHAQVLVESLLRGAAHQPLSVMLLDLDRFKRVNDRHGHAGGDAVLQRSAAVMRESLRQQDGVGRWGGEEFVVWLPGTARDDALGVAEKLRQALRACAHPMPGLDVPLTVTASIGVAEIAPGEPLLQALSRADGAMYEAKRGGRDRVVCAA